MSKASVITIGEGAILIADSHYNPLGRTDIVGLLNAIADRKIETKQLFLLGDISELLVSGFPMLIGQNRDLIDAIDRIANAQIEVYYFEGNHDFFLEGIFDDRVKIIRRSDQPLYGLLNDKKIALLHGDIRVRLRYIIYTHIVRHRFVIFLVHILSFNFINGWLFHAIFKRAHKKTFSYEIKDFAQKRAAQLSQLCKKADILVEGHFHQGCDFEMGGAHYYNVGAFACGQSFVQIKSSDEGLTLCKMKWET
ncbi:UDP-2,3-diacylglucosamine hydrolase [Campylobacterota bacterium]|nr:UDP-2,3-diacylglucosamine hydrolase [Campylobacterota bacterium]